MALRVCPSIRLFWIENSKVTKLKRYDHHRSNIGSSGLIEIVKHVYPEFDGDKHIVKYQDNQLLVDLTPSDEFVFQFNEHFSQIFIFIFTSASEAIHMVALDPPRAEVPSSQTSLRMQKCVPRADQSQRPSTSFSPLANLRTSSADIVLGHPGVSCDRCSCAIPTNRYICLECQNYDLCAACESRSVHDHLMVRVPLSFVKREGVNHQSILNCIVCKARNAIPEVSRDCPF